MFGQVPGQVLLAPELVLQLLRGDVDEGAFLALRGWVAFHEEVVDLIITQLAGGGSESSTDFIASADSYAKDTFPETGFAFHSSPATSVS